MYQDIHNKNSTVGIALAIVASVIIVVFSFWFFPTYNVWQQSLSGQAKLQEAEWSKKIIIEEALEWKEKYLEAFTCLL
jgi:hypothetical protein